MDDKRTNALDEALVHPGYHIIDNFLSDQDYRALQSQIQALAQNEFFRPAKVGQAADTALQLLVRTDHICWLNESLYSPALVGFHTAIDRLRQRLNRTLFLGLEQFEAHFAIYQPGQFYKKHIDQFQRNKDRRISCVYYLNDDWQPTYGGELCIYDTTQQCVASIFPSANRLVCFDSSMLHEVLPTQHIRYSIAGWLKSRPLSLS